MANVGSKARECLVYTACSLQLPVDSVSRVDSRETARQKMFAKLNHIGAKVNGAKSWVGESLKLVVLPEYILTSFPQGEGIAEWADKAAIDIDGPEYEQLGEIAQSNGIYLAGNAYETDPHFPEFYFQTCFILSPSGKVILRYRRLNSMFAPTPYDVWDKYLDIYGLDGVFPVADTEIGMLAAIASEEILFPELSRCFSMRGAEVFTHSSSELSGPFQSIKDAAKICRASENLCYVVSSNTAGILNTSLPSGSADGGSRIINYRGEVLRISGSGENISATAELDLVALRRERRKTGLGNTFSRQRFQAYADSYNNFSFQNANGLLNKDGSLKEPSRQYFLDSQKETLYRLQNNGTIS